MPNFPASAPSFSTLVDLVDSVLAAHQNLPNDEIEAIGTFLLSSIFPQGALINGHFVRTVSSNNLTVAIKASNGNDPSSTNPVYIKIGGSIRSITSALSVTVNAGAASGSGTFNLGAAPFVNLEQDVFVYLGYRVSDTSVFIGISRIPYGRVYSDFSATAANEKHLAYSGSAPASTDTVENIGRFNIANSGSASYNWSVPANDISINRRTTETRWLTFLPAPTGFSSAPTSTVYRYKMIMENLFFEYVEGADGTSNATTFTATFPFSALNTFTWPLSTTVDNGVTLTTPGRVVIAAGSTTITFRKDTASGAWTGSGGKRAIVLGFYPIA